MDLNKPFGVKINYEDRKICEQYKIWKEDYMTSESLDLTRRKFLIASSVVIASPLFLDVAGSMAAGKTVETKTTETGIAKGTRIYYINDGCVGCQSCRTFCPAQAIRFGNCRNEIDQKKCIHCGTCYRECPICVISETIVS
jgi:ferredoxin